MSTADDKCTLLNRDNLMQPIQKQLSQKQKVLSAFLAKVLKSRLNFEDLPKKPTLRANVFPKVRTSKIVVR